MVILLHHQEMRKTHRKMCLNDNPLNVTVTKAKFTFETVFYTLTVNEPLCFVALLDDGTILGKLKWDTASSIQIPLRTHTRVNICINSLLLARQTSGKMFPSCRASVRGIKKRHATSIDRPEF